MIEIVHDLFIGSERDCFRDYREDWAVIHACKIPCHQISVGYRGSLPQDHPNYLHKRESNHLYLNMVDMDKPLLPKFTHPIIAQAMSFIDEYRPNRKILIHCNHGYSRAPSIALIYLARKVEIINSSYEEARSDLLRLYPLYRPASGIESYLQSNWRDLMEL